MDEKSRENDKTSTGIGKVSIAGAGEASGQSQPWSFRNCTKGPWIEIIEEWQQRSLLFQNLQQWSHG